ncbi:MAG: MotE family protein [Bdellovibrionota bacterium]
MKSRLVLATGCFLLFIAAVGLVRAEDVTKPAEGAEAVQKAADKAAAEAKAPKKSSAPLALSAEAIQELEDRKTALDQRETRLNERAHDLELQEKLLKEKLKKMEDLNRKMAERLDVFKKDHEGRIGKLVTMVEGMKPEAAARYVEALDPDLAVEILARIKEAKASKILNLVDKKMGAKLTELYTGYRESADDAAPAAQPTNAKEAPAANKPM